MQAEEIREMAEDEIVNRIADDAGLSDKDRAMLKRWRSSKMKLGGDDMQLFRAASFEQRHRLGAQHG